MAALLVAASAAALRVDLAGGPVEIVATTRRFFGPQSFDHANLTAPLVSLSYGESGSLCDRGAALGS